MKRKKFNLIKSDRAETNYWLREIVLNLKCLQTRKIRQNWCKLKDKV
jgi:hypothetical protein